MASSSTTTWFIRIPKSDPKLVEILPFKVYDQVEDQSTGTHLVSSKDFFCEGDVEDTNPNGNHCKVGSHFGIFCEDCLSTADKKELSECPKKWGCFVKKISSEDTPPLDKIPKKLALIASAKVKASRENGVINRYQTCTNEQRRELKSLLDIINRTPGDHHLCFLDKEFRQRSVRLYTESFMRIDELFFFFFQCDEIQKEFFFVFLAPLRAPQSRSGHYASLTTGF